MINAEKAIAEVKQKEADLYVQEVFTKAEVEQMAQDVPNAMNELKTMIAKTIRKMKPEEQKEIQGMIGKWAIEMMNIKEIIQGQKIRQAYDGLKAIKEQVLAQKEKMAAPTEVKIEKK